MINGVRRVWRRYVEWPWSTKKVATLLSAVFVAVTLPLMIWAAVDADPLVGIGVGLYVAIFLGPWVALAWIVTGLTALTRVGLRKYYGDEPSVR